MNSRMVPWSAGVVCLLMSLVACGRNDLADYTVRDVTEDSATTSTEETAVPGPDLFIITTVSGRILTSKDGEAWSVVDTRANEILNAAAYGNGVYVLVGERGVVMSSTDTETWEFQEATDQNIRSLAFAHSQFYAFGGPSYWTSQDGITWDLIRQDLYKYSYDERAVSLIEGEVYVDAGHGWYILDKDGNVSTSFTTNFPLSCDSLIYKKKFICFEQTGATIRVHSSIEGTNWDYVDLDNVSEEMGVAAAVAETSDVMVATHGGSGGISVSSDLGMTWQYVQETGGRQANGVAYGNGKFVAVGEVGVIYSSGDGVNWEENDNHTDIGWMNGVFFLD